MERRASALGTRRAGVWLSVLCSSPGTFAPALLGSWREAAMVPSDRARRTYSTLHAIHNSREFRGSRACTGGMACAFRLPARRPHPAELWRVHNSRLGARGGLRLARCCACGLVGHRLRLHRRVSGPGVSAHVRVHWYARVCMYARSYRYDREPGRSPVCAARVILASKRDASLLLRRASLSRFRGGFPQPFACARGIMDETIGCLLVRTCMVESRECRSSS